MFYIIIAAAALIITIAANTILAGSVDKNKKYHPVSASDEAVARLAEAIRIPTVSHYDHSLDVTSLFSGFQDYLFDIFPLFHETAERTVLSEYAVIYKWDGSSPDKHPVLLTAHYDVVPADVSKWSRPPFDAVIEDGYLWGRGTLDTKNTLMASLEAAEELCRTGFTPERTVYFAFGGDEEITGALGAKTSAQWFADNGISFDWAWDEGSITADRLMPGMKVKLSLIGTSEKGQVNILLKAESRGGGHAAMPPKHTATGRIARAVTRIEANPFPLRWLKTTRTFFKRMARAGVPAYRVALSNLWLTGGLIKLVMGRNAKSAAMLRTTTAPTIITGSNKENVLADEASAVVNVRILPGDSIKTVVKRIKKVVADDEVSVSVLKEKEATEPAFESSIKSEGYLLLEQMLNEEIEDAVVLPYLATIATDSVNFSACCKNLYRYAPMILNQEELDRIHGVDERISFENYGLAIRCYKNFIKKL
ncbi:MAG TPA: hypothetical protein DCO79_00620 [Spirochaeta sp.]|nr:hypothetical protein [Spirochaeta sp.]